MRGILAFSILTIWIYPFLLVAEEVNKNLKPGVVFKDCEVCPEMVVVPKGLYIMGLGGKNRHGPPLRVVVSKPFAIGRYEVKFNEWFACVSDGACLHRPNDHNWGSIGRPVINITWPQTKNFTRWLSKKTGHKYRLPSEAEWEYVARAGTTTQYWWGDLTEYNMANCRDCESRKCCSTADHSCCSTSTKPVGSFPANPFGLFDTAGNVFEWTEDCWHPSHKGRPKISIPRKDGDCTNRVIRGGSFYYFSKVARSYYRAKNPPDVKSYWLGFRVLRELR